MEEELTKEQLERYYDYVGKGECPECERYAELFVYKAKNKLLFEGQKNLYWDLKNKELSDRLLSTFATEGHPLNIAVTTIEGNEKKAVIKEVDYEKFVIKNPVITPSGVVNYEVYLIKTDFKTAKIYKRTEEILCAKCIFTTIQNHLDSSVGWKPAQPVRRENGIREETAVKLESTRTREVEQTEHIEIQLRYHADVCMY